MRRVALVLAWMPGSSAVSAWMPGSSAVSAWMATRMFNICGCCYITRWNCASEIGPTETGSGGNNGVQLGEPAPAAEEGGAGVLSIGASMLAWTM